MLRKTHLFPRNSKIFATRNCSTEQAADRCDARGTVSNSHDAFCDRCVIFDVNTTSAKAMADLSASLPACDGHARMIHRNRCRNPSKMTDDPRSVGPSVCGESPPHARWRRLRINWRFDVATTGDRYLLGHVSAHAIKLPLTPPTSGTKSVEQRSSRAVRQACPGRSSSILLARKSTSRNSTAVWAR